MGWYGGAVVGVSEARRAEKAEQQRLKEEEQRHAKAAAARTQQRCQLKATRELSRVALETNCRSAPVLFT
jgi:hypothetical protein